VKLPFNFNMNIVEIRIIHIAMMSADHSRRKRAHFDFLSLWSEPAEGLKFNEAIKQINYSFS